MLNLEAQYFAHLCTQLKILHFEIYIFHEIHQISCMKSAGFHAKWAKIPWIYF